MLQKLYAFLARAPALAGVTLAVGDAGPAPGTAGLWCKGVTVLEQRENLLGTVRQRCRAEFTLRLCLPLPPGDSATAAENAAHLLALQTWVAAECAAGPGLWQCRPGPGDPAGRAGQTGTRRRRRHRRVQPAHPRRIHTTLYGGNPMKIERKYMAHYLNAAFGKGEADYTRLGQDLEEYAPELTANVEKKSNILGQTSVVIDGYQKQGEVSPYYAEEGDPLFEKLQGIIDGDLVLDDLKTDIVEVKLWSKDTAGAYPAVREECYIEIVSYGGDTTGYQIPFNIHYTGVKTKGTFDPASKKFTEA